MKQATLERSNSQSGNSGLLVELRMPSFQMNDQQTPWNFTLAICIVFQTNQYRSSNGTFESRFFRQACAVRNADLRYRIDEESKPIRIRENLVVNYKT